MTDTNQTIDNNTTHTVVRRNSNVRRRIRRGNMRLVDDSLSLPYIPFPLLTEDIPPLPPPEIPITDLSNRSLYGVANVINRFLSLTDDDLNEIFGLPEDESVQYDLFLETYDSEVVKKKEKVIVVNEEIYENTPKKYCECSICIETFNNDSTIAVLSCEHYFHIGCIKEWGKYNNICPLCRTILE